MTKRKYDAHFYLDAPFGEALERFTGTKPKEVADSIAKSKKAVPSGGKLTPPPDHIAQSKNVTRLASKRKHNGK